MLSWWFWTVYLKPREFLHPAPNKKREAHPQVAEVAAPWEADQASIHLTLWDLLRPSRRTLGQKWVALRCSRSSWPQKNVRYQHVFEGWIFLGEVFTLFLNDFDEWRRKNLYGSTWRTLWFLGPRPWHMLRPRACCMPAGPLNHLPPPHDMTHQRLQSRKNALKQLNKQTVQRHPPQKKLKVKSH